MRRPELSAGLVALALGLLHLLLLPDSGTDTAAQLARASFARDAPLTPVDLSWFIGVHPYGYSLVAPWVMAVLGVGLSGVVAAVGMAVLFARLLRDSDRPLLAALLGAVFAVANTVSGRTTFGLGAVAALAALVLLPRLRWALPCAVLSGLLSPVAAAFLGFAAGVLVLHRRPGGWRLGIACTVPVLLLGLWFPAGGTQPWSLGGAVPLVLVAVGIAVLTTHPLVRTGALLYAAAGVLFAFTSDPFGGNVQRLGILAAASVLVAWSVRPAPVLAVAVAGCLIWQLNPVRGDLRVPESPPTTALTAELERLGADRVEVVPVRDHREASDVVLDVPVARGWSRQLDVKNNQLFYTGHLEQVEYLTWLRARGVDHVAVPRHGVLDYAGQREFRLLRQPVEGLERVWEDRDWAVYRVDGTPGLADAEVVSSGRTEMVLRVSRPGPVLVRLHWSRWLSARGAACVEQDGNGVRLQATRPGLVTLSSSLMPFGHC